MGDTLQIASGLTNPILNGPYDEPTRHYPFDEGGMLSGGPIDGRRPSSEKTPIPGRRRAQGTLDLGVDAEQIVVHKLVDDIRAQVKAWRSGGWGGATPTSRRLLEHWSARDTMLYPLYFAQREAIETAIWLAEVAPRQQPRTVELLTERGNVLNSGLFRVCHKMATGTGKTRVMGLLIAWHTLNKAANPQDARFTDLFLVVAPGLTIKDRLRELDPAFDGNAYESAALVPPELLDQLSRATVVIENYHTLMPRSKSSDLTSGTKRVLGITNDTQSPFVETTSEMAARVLRAFPGTKQLVVLNDEAHHCYQEGTGRELIDPEDGKRTPVKALRATDLKGQAGKDARDENARARKWHAGLQAIHRKRGIKTVYDVSATPFYLSGSGWPEGTLFQWVVSDFSLADAIESGLVKIPRVPVADDTTKGNPGFDQGDPAFRNLWDKVKTRMPKGRKSDIPTGEPSLPVELQAALEALYADYANWHEEWRTEVLPDDPSSVPPVFIVVANNTNTSALIHRWLGGWEEKDSDGKVLTRHPGRLPLFNNVDPATREWFTKPSSIVVDSKTLDDPDAQIPDEFRAAIEDELASFRRERELRDPTLRGIEVSDSELLREVMNTVGKRNALGSHVRCVVSVSMLTEGWDATTVTHILGVRAFGTKLLCEQVVGRGLRRVSHDLNEAGLFEPEYADIYGVPFTFVPVAGDRTAEPPKALTEVFSQQDRPGTTITFPRITGYRLATPPEELTVKFSDKAHMVLDTENVPTETLTAGVIGAESVQTLDAYKSLRDAQVHFEIAKAVVDRLRSTDGDLRPWLFPQVRGIVEQWDRECLTIHAPAFRGLLLLDQYRDEAADRIYGAIAASTADDGTPIISPIVDAPPTGDTGAVFWVTRIDRERLHATDTRRCQINYVVPHSSWERKFAMQLENMHEVVSYAKNDHLGFTIPYVLDGVPHRYTPDFIVVVDDRDELTRTRHPDGGRQDPLQMLIEVTGNTKDRAKQTKVRTTQHLWLPSVNADGRWGRWTFAEITDPAHVAVQLRAHIETLRDDS